MSGEYCSEASNLRNQPTQWDYKYVGRLEDFQDNKFIFLQYEEDINRIYSEYGIDDDFRHYMVTIGNEGYEKIFGVTGITLDSLVYEYRVV